MDLLALRGISKRFGATVALSGVDFDLRAGEVHALVGANGAGKSTLSRIISGHVSPDAGEILLDGKPVRHAGARDAIRDGIAMVTQETSLAPDLSVLENIMLPRLAMPGRLRWSALREQARALIDELGQADGLRLDDPVYSLSIGQRQLVEILKSLALGSRIVIFDEPTASLSPHEAERLFDIIRRLAASGRGLIFVSHRLEEIFAVTDRVSVLREGQMVARNRDTASLNQGELVRLMVGRDLGDIYARPTGTTRPVGDVVLSVRGLSCPPRVRDVSFDVRAGEILGLAGLVGAGRSETLETIFGLRHAAAGTVTLNGERFSAGAPLDAIRAGIGLIPEDRGGQGIVPDFSVRENLLLAHLGAHRGAGLAYRGQAGRIGSLLETLGLPASRLLDANMLNFSGGMQQKVILARWLLLEPRLLLLDEPTRGVDIGTRSSIYALLRRIAAEGVACVVVSSDFEEVIGLADRVVVLSDGVTVTDIPSQLVDIEKLGMFAAPRSSAERTHTLLEQLVLRYGGIAYWIALEGDRLFCFDRVGNDADADPGFIAGGFPDIAATNIAHIAHMAHAVPPAEAGVAAAPDGTYPTVLAPVVGRRGHSLGLVGLTLARVPADFDATAIRRLITAELGAPTAAIAA
jgi:ribose transport system ATP-binding protein/rhamnose transport system ATP-binding protein